MGENRDSVAPSKGKVPRICDLVNITPIPKQPSGSTLQAIADGVVKPLDELWAWGEKLGAWDARWNNNTEEEKWARAISELLVGTAYFGPNIASYGTQDRTPFYESFCSNNPTIAIVNPCETLATYLVLSRGYSLDDVSKVGLDSGDNSSLPLFKGNGGKWQTSDETRKFEKVIAAGDLKPGSCYGWYKFANGEKALGSHVVGVLRVDEEAKTAQILDTGAAQSRLGPGGTPYSTHSWGLHTIRGNYDNTASKTVDPVISQAPYKGMGTPATTSKLSEGLKRLKKTRPFGLARLFVATDPLKGAPKTEQVLLKDPDPKKTVTLTVPTPLVFMSKVCRMWGAKDTENYSIMRCQWALRALPKWKASQDGPELPAFAWWVFYCPKSELANMLFKAGRDQPLDQLTTGEDKKKLLSPIHLIVRSDKDGKTDWSFVLRALEPTRINSVPGWMSKMLEEANFETVFNRHNVAIPAPLNDGVDQPAVP